MVAAGADLHRSIYHHLGHMGADSNGPKRFHHLGEQSQEQCISALPCLGILLLQWRVDHLQHVPGHQRGDCHAIKGMARHPVASRVLHHIHCHGRNLRPLVHHEIP